MLIFNSFFRSKLVLITGILIFPFISIAQGYSKILIRCLNAAPTFESPQKELELLPDTPSYHIMQELYNADTLTFQGSRLIFHNNGDKRISILSSTDLYTVIVHLQKIDDTYSLQTAERINRNHVDYDTTQVWWKDGIIVKAIVKSDDIQGEYSYEYCNKKLIQKKVAYSWGDTSETSYIYQGDQLVTILFSSNRNYQETHISYSDSLIISETAESNNSGNTAIKSYTRLDAQGRKKSFKVFIQGFGEEPNLYQSEEYSYDQEGHYQMSAFVYNPTRPLVNKLEFHPGIPTIEKWTWEDDDQVWILKSYPD